MIPKKDLDNNYEKAALIAFCISELCSDISKANSARAGNMHDRETVIFYWLHKYLNSPNTESSGDYTDNLPEMRRLFQNAWNTINIC